MSVSNASSSARKRDFQLLDRVVNYRTYVSKTLWRMTLLAWALSWAFAFVHNTWALSLLIGDILYRLQSTSQTSVSVVKESAEQAQENLLKVQQAVTVFADTSRALEQMILHGGQISAASSEQERTANSLMAQAEQVKATADNSEAAVVRVKQGVSQLSQEYEQLKRGLQVFKA